MQSEDQLLTAIIIVDHGSRRAASNAMLEVAVSNFRETASYDIVEPAHMELAEPDIATAFDRCVSEGAQRVIVFPYFLSPGRHWSEDIPQLVEEAARNHSNVEWIVTAPFGLHPQMSQIIEDRILQCLRVAEAGKGHCDVCTEGTCQLHAPSADRT